MKTFLLVLSIMILGAAPVATVAKSKKEAPEYTIEGLKLVPNTKLALVYAEAGQVSDARKAVEKILRLDPRFSALAYLRGLPLSDPDQQDRCRSALKIAGLPD